jgi:sugar phosphate isomerase/epimerase
VTHTISLSFLTVFDAQPLDAIKIAAQTGYDALGLRLLPAAARGEPNYPLMTDNRLLMECRALLADTGLTLTDVEIVRLGADTNASDYTAFFERCAELGARHVVVAGDDSDFPRLIEAFSKLCEIAEGFDLTCDLEFMPWTGCWFSRGTEPVFSPRSEPPLSMVF